MRDHLTAVYRMTGQTPAELDVPELPEVAEYLWDHYQSLSRGRTSNGFGANPLSYPDIDAWARLLDVELEAWEVEVIKLIDMQYLIAQAESQAKKNK